VIYPKFQKHLKVKIRILFWRSRRTEKKK